MGFKIPDSHQERAKEIYNLKYIHYNGERRHITSFENKTVTPDMYYKMRANSYALDEMPPKLTDTALISMAEDYLRNARPMSPANFPCTTYDEALVHRILPELLKRFKEQPKGDAQDEH